MALSNTRSRKRLAILIDETGLLVAESSENGDSTTLSKVARFSEELGNSLEHLPGTAMAFVAFLKKQGFTSRRAVFGLPARQLMLLRHELPAADDETTTSALWLHASSAMPPELGITSFDYLSDSQDPQVQQVTLVGVQQVLFDRLRAFCSGAGLQAECAMPTAFALAQATGRLNGDALILQRREAASELLVQVNHLPRLLRSVTGASPSALQSELRRAAAQLPASGTSNAFVVWDGSSVDSAQDASLASAAGMPLTRPDIDALGLSRYGVTSNRDLMVAALVDAATNRERRCINLLNPRIVEPRRMALHRGRLIAMVAGAALFVLLGAGWFDLQRLTAETARTQAQLDSLQADVRNAKPLIQRLEYLAAFSNAQPRYLACLRDLTEGVEAIVSIHLDHFDLDQAMQGNCSGQAAVQKDALEFVDRLNSSKRFSKVNCKLDTETSANDGEKVSFRIAFAYLPAE